MSWEQLGLWGCERSGYLDLWNNARTAAYIKKFSLEASSLGAGASVDITHALIADSAPVGLYTFVDPVTDNAWWYDISRPESAGFLGLQVTRVDGLESNVITQDSDIIMNNLHTLVYKQPVNRGFTITIEGIVTGLTPYSLNYGIRALRKKLEGCRCNSCCGTRLRMVRSEYLAAASCAPTWNPPSQATVPPFRNLFNVKIAEQPSVIAGWTSPISRKITFTLRSQGELYLDPVILLYQQALAGFGCNLSCSPTAASPPNLTRDPNLTAGPLPKAPNAVLSVPPPIVSQQYRVLTFPSTMFDSELELIIHAGSTNMYGITVKAWPYNPSISSATGLYNDTNVCQGFGIPFIGAGVTYTRQVCNGLQVSKPPYAQNARGTMLDWQWLTPNLSMRFGGQQWLVSIEADSGVATDAWITLNAVMVEP